MSDRCAKCGHDRADHGVYSETASIPPLPVWWCKPCFFNNKPDPHHEFAEPAETSARAD